jgi:hypothetical protein
VNARNEKTATLPLRPDLAEDLKAHMALFLPTAPVFPGMQKKSGAEMLTMDLNAAGIPVADDCGLVVDFHSLRHAFASLGAKAVLPLAVMQKLMRHCDPKLTAGVYTHLRLIDQASEIAKLPEFSPLPIMNEGEATGTDGKTVESIDTKIDTSKKTCLPMIPKTAVSIEDVNKGPMATGVEKNFQ